MFDYSLNGVTLRLTIDKRKSDKDDRYLLRWCVTQKRKRAYFSTGIRLSFDDWDILESSRKLSIKEVRDSLQTYFVEVIQKHVRELAERDVFSFDVLEAKLKGAKVCTVNDLFKEKIKELRASGSIGNATIYQGVLNAIEVFSGDKIQFSGITVKWLNDYLKYMEKGGISYATMGMRFRTIRSVFNDAIQKGIVKEISYPFGRGKFQVPTGSGRNMALSIDDIKRIAEYECNETLSMCRDMWLFSFYCNGANFGDICRMKYRDIENGEIYFYRKKTLNTSKDKREIIAPILEPMQTIIDCLGNEDKSGLIFPFCNDCTTEEQFKHNIHNLIRLTNKQIKIISKALDLPSVSTYTARHSYATILAKKRVPESYIADALGHANKTITQNYFDEYDKEERIKYNSILL